MVGVDADSSGINRTRENFSWLRQDNPQIPEPALIVADIRKLPSVLSGSKYEAIVTEPYLGPPLSGHESETRLEQIHQELAGFYKMTLQVLAQVVKDDGRIVMVWPVLRGRKNNMTLPLIEEVENFGLRIVPLLPKEVPESWQNKRGTLWYARPDARVIREIVVLKKNK